MRLSHVRPVSWEPIQPLGSETEQPAITGRLAFRNPRGYRPMVRVAQRQSGGRDSRLQGIDAVMAAQTDLVGIEHTLKQVLSVKG